MSYQDWFKFSNAELAVRHRVNGLSRHILDSVLGAGTDGTETYPFYVDGGNLKHKPFSTTVNGFYMEFPNDTSDDILFGVLGATNYVYVLYTETFEPTAPTKLMSITPFIIVQDSALAAPDNSYHICSVAGGPQGSFIAVIIENSQTTLNFVRRINVPEIFMGGYEVINSDRVISTNVPTVGLLETSSMRLWNYSESGLTTAIAADPAWTKLATSGYKPVGGIPTTYKHCLILAHIECQNLDMGVGAT